MKAIGSTRVAFLAFALMAVVFGYYHAQIAYTIDVWGLSGKAPSIDAERFAKIDRSAWKMHTVSSFEPWNDEGLVQQAWDGNPETFWHSEWKSKKTKMPQHLAIDMGDNHMIFAVEYLPRQAKTSTNGRVKDYAIWLSDDGEKWVVVARGIFAPGAVAQLIRLQPPRAARYIKLECLSEMNGGASSAVAELHALTLD